MRSAGLPGRSVPPGSSEHPRRAGGQELDQPREVDDPGAHQAVEAQGERRLEADDAERRQAELDVLLVGVMGRVVAGDGVHRAVGEAGEERLAIRRRAQRRLHLGVGREAGLGHRLVGEQEVVRRHLAGGRQPAPLGGAHQVEGARGRQVRDVVAPAGLLEQQEVARHHHVLRQTGDPRQAEPGRPLALVHHALAGEGQVLGVLHDRQAEVLGVEQRAAHQLGVRDRPAVVGDGDRAGPRQLSHLGQLLAREPLLAAPTG